MKKSEDKSLYEFCNNIRYAHNHPDKSSVVVNEERVASLNALGFDWIAKQSKRASVVSFEQRVEDLRDFKLKHGHLNLNKNEDPSLYGFCINVRNARNTGKPGLTEERIASLDAIGFEWAAKENKRTSFEQRLEDLNAYKLKHGQLNVRKEEDPSLYNFCNSIRTSRNNTGKPGMKKLTEDRIASLDTLRFDWDPRKKSSG